MLLRLFILALALAGCGDAPDSAPTFADASPSCADEPAACADASSTCDYMGTIYEDGELFPAGDGCNGCKCNPSGNTPGDWGCSLVNCEGVACRNDFVAPGYCPAHCSSLPSVDATPFWCAKRCEDATVCDGMACHPDGYCVPACSGDLECQLQSGSFDRCDVASGHCTFD